MPITLSPETPPLRPQLDGSVRVGSTRVPLETVVAAHASGASPEEIVETYPTLQLADVYAAISYYLRHRAEVDEYMKQREAARRELIDELERTSPQQDLRDTLMSRLSTALPRRGRQSNRTSSPDSQRTMSVPAMATVRYSAATTARMDEQFDPHRRPVPPSATAGRAHELTAPYPGAHLT